MKRLPAHADWQIGLLWLEMADASPVFCGMGATNRVRGPALFCQSKDSGSGALVGTGSSVGRGGSIHSAIPVG
jgi:hypothetical protein